MTIQHWTTEQLRLAQIYGICRICGEPRNAAIRKREENDYQHGLFCTKDETHGPSFTQPGWVELTEEDRETIRALWT